jgi:hypothetical protein
MQTLSSRQAARASKSVVIVQYEASVEFDRSARVDEFASPHSPSQHGTS